MALKFITRNKNKVLEARATLSPIKLEGLNIELNEIQEIDSKKIIEHKLNEALKHHPGPFIIDDSSLFLSCFNYKLPGPLIKWFNTTIGIADIYKICSKMGDFKAFAETYIGLVEKNKKITYFKGGLEGVIVAPRGKYGFGYDLIFEPKGYKQTLSEMKSAGNFSFSPRGIAIKKLKKYLLKHQK